MEEKPKVQFRLSYALIYLFAAGCAFFTLLKIGDCLLGGPDYAKSLLLDVFYTSNGAGFERRLFWTGLSGLPLLFLALAAPSLKAGRFVAVFTVCLALSLLPALFYASMHMVSVEYYAARGVDTSMDFLLLALNLWPTTVSLLCYAHIGVDALIRNLVSGKRSHGGSR